MSRREPCLSHIQMSLTPLHPFSCGTSEYLAPEVLLGRAYSYPVDLWSLGTMVFEMLLGVVSLIEVAPPTGEQSLTPLLITNRLPFTTRTTPSCTGECCTSLLASSSGATTLTRTRELSFEA